MSRDLPQKHNDWTHTTPRQLPAVLDVFFNVFDMFVVVDVLSHLILEQENPAITAFYFISLEEPLRLT